MLLCQHIAGQLSEAYLIPIADDRRLLVSLLHLCMRGMMTQLCFHELHVKEALLGVWLLSMWQQVQVPLATYLLRQGERTQGGLGGCSAAGRADGGR